jgi:3-dehydroquinate dehydratase-2
MIIHILNGPNLNLIGKRQPEIYGTVAIEDYIHSIRDRYREEELIYYQSNHEGDLIDYLQLHGFEDHSGFILNAGGLSHTSISLRDAVSSIYAPVVEVHISDITTREPFRHQSYLTEVCRASFIGLGLEGYKKAIDFLLLNNPKSKL